MATKDDECCEMRETDLDAVELWEDSHGRFEQKVHDLSPKYESNSPFFKITEKIRGCFVIIINYYTTFTEFSSSQEALNLTFGALDEFSRLEDTYPDDEPYFVNLFQSIKEMSTLVHNIFVSPSNNSTNFPPLRTKPTSKPSVLKQPVLQLPKLTESQDKDNPAKRKKSEENSGKKPKREAAASSFETKNKFQVLADISDTEEATASQSQVTQDSQCLEMDAVDSNAPTETARTATKSVTKKEPRPPPITVLGHDNLFLKNKEIKGLIKGEMKVVNTKEGFRYYFSSVEDYKIVKQHLKDQNQEFFTFQIRSELPLRVILKRLPSSMDPEDIKLELSHLGFPVRAVKQFTKKDGDTIVKLPTFIVELTNTDKAKEIYDLKRLLYTVVAVESYRPRSGLKQCFRCQRFNHTWPGCSLAPRCLLCAKAHNHKDCPIKQQSATDRSKLRCANCDQVGHPASSHDCESYKEALKQFLKPKEKSNAKTTNIVSTGRTFTSKKVTQGLSYSSAVDQNSTKSHMASSSAQRRLQKVTAQRWSAPTGGSTSVEQLVKDINPMLAGLNSAMDKFMVLSKLVEICFGNV